MYSITVPAGFLAAIDKLKFICKYKKPKIVETVLKKNEVRELTLSDFKTYKVMVVKTVVLSEG